jgi:hypothetical protein
MHQPLSSLVYALVRAMKVLEQLLEFGLYMSKFEVPIFAHGAYPLQRCIGFLYRIRASRNAVLRKLGWGSGERVKAFGRRFEGAYFIFAESLFRHCDLL